MNLRAVGATVGLVLACGVGTASAKVDEFHLAPFTSMQSQYFNEVDDGATGMQQLFERAPAHAPEGLIGWTLA
jgi:hypothetical protein